VSRAIASYGNDARPKALPNHIGIADLNWLHRASDGLITSHTAPSKLLEGFLFPSWGPGPSPARRYPSLCLFACLECLLSLLPGPSTSVRLLSFPPQDPPSFFETLPKKPASPPPKRVTRSAALPSPQASFLFGASRLQSSPEALQLPLSDQSVQDPVFRPVNHG